MAGLTRTVDCTVEPVSLDEAKRHLRRLDSYEDTTIQEYVTAARSLCEESVGQAFVTQTWEYKLDRWPRVSPENRFGSIELARGPVQAVSSVSYLNTAGATTTMPSSDYVVSTGHPGRVTPRFGISWPLITSQADCITVTYKAGYGGAAASTDSEASAAAVPGTIKSAIKIYTGYLMVERDQNTPMPAAVLSLLSAAHTGQYMHQTPDA
jgi:uncharacterized phiE125 gp8 family phage protein